MTGPAWSAVMNGIAFARFLGNSWQAIDPFDPCGIGSGRPLSAEQGQKRQCAFLVAMPGPSGPAAGQTGTVSAVRYWIRKNDA
jgi:hypothetical protein